MSEAHGFWWFSQFVPSPVLALIFYECGHRTWFHFGTPLVSKSCFFAIVFDDMLDLSFIDFWPQRQPNLVVVFLILSSLFPRGFFGTSIGSLWRTFGSIVVLVHLRVHFGSVSQYFPIFFNKTSSSKHEQSIVNTSTPTNHSNISETWKNKTDADEFRLIPTNSD